MKVVWATVIVFLVQTLVLVSGGNDYNDGDDNGNDCSYLWMMMQRNSGYPLTGLSSLFLVCLSVTAALVASTDRLT